MKKIYIIYLAIFFITGCSYKASKLYYTPQGDPLYNIGNLNDYPIVLVHGFGGFGRDELIGYKYWGGLVDIQERLKDHGYKTLTATIGPFSSNWDRACELYAFIKGGIVDYGLVHSQKYGHKRYGRYYPGLYPEWGEKDPQTGKINKIHIIAHSQGGQTSRTLIQLLSKGFKEERDKTPEYDLNSLFKGNKHWVHSLTTISTPHDGMTVNYMVNTLFPLAQRITRSGGLLSRQIDGFLYDFKLDQWEIDRKEDESFWDYTKRLRKNMLWKKTSDTSEHDLSPEGAKELNKWVKAQPDVYYFSYATEETFESPFSGHEYPEISMDFIWFFPSIFMGAYENDPNSEIKIDKSWWKNDGVVNTNSMDGPTIGSEDIIVNFNGQPQKGKWNYMGLLDSCDHADITGGLRYPGETCPEGYSSLLDWYFYLAEFINRIPD